jgi:hypothetical protein
MTNKLMVRYNVHLSLGAGGGRIGSFKTLAEAREFVGKQNLFIWKTYYEKHGDKYYSVHTEQVN